MRVLWVPPVLLALCVGGCAVKHSGSMTDPPLRMPVEAPERFTMPDGTGATGAAPAPSCRNPITDPRDGTVLTLIRSAGGRGDYRPQPLRYGLREGELLRVDCATGRAVGIVRGER